MTERFAELQDLLTLEPIDPNIYRGQNDDRHATAIAPTQKVDITVSPTGRRSCGWSQALHINDDDGDFAADSK
jgi:hypothetical protein